jgi:hypothetical protein
MSEKEYVKLSESEKKKEDWMNSKWRPMMGWSYMLTCIADFVIFPVLWSVLQSLSKGQVNIQWQPITLQGAGLYHIAMGAVLGIAAYGRTQEKLGGANNGGLQGNVGTTYTPPAPVGQQPQGSYNAPTSMPTSFGSTTGGFQSGYGATPPMSTGFSGGFGAPSGQVTTGFRGKAAPPAAYEPEI